MINKLKLLFKRNESPVVIDGNKEISFTSQQDELDYIYMLLTYAITFETWQKNKDKKKRGHNIGAILVNKNNEIVAHDFNSITSKNDGSQHAEFRVMSKYLKSTSEIYLKGYSIYTTLEPCSMCSGMMTILLVDKVVYGQKDPQYGGTLQKLANSYDDLPAYPLQVKYKKSNDFISKSLDVSYAQSDVHQITFLYSKVAQDIFKLAKDQLFNYSISFKNNKLFYEKGCLYVNSLAKSTN